MAKSMLTKAMDKIEKTLPAKASAPKPKAPKAPRAPRAPRAPKDIWQAIKGM